MDNENIFLDPVEFMKRVVEKLTPEVADIVMRKDSGTFEIHFSGGQLTRIRKDVTL